MITRAESLQEYNDSSSLMAWTGKVISSYAFNLSMQVLRSVTFPPCGSPLPLSAFDSYRVALSSMCVVLKMHFCCSVRVCPFVCQVHVCVIANEWVLQSHWGLVQETRFDTSIVKITCVQTVIALQTIRTTIIHF